MKVKTWLPLAAAPLVGIAAGAMFYHASQSPGQAGPPTPAVSDAAPAGWFGSAAAELIPGMGSGAATSAARSAFEAALHQPPGEARTLALQQTFTRWMLDAPAEAIAHVNSIPVEERRTVITAALAALARQSPASVAAYAAALGQDGADWAAVIAALAEQDPVLAIDWISRHRQFDVNGALTAAALPRLIERDVSAAAKTVADMQDRAPLALVQQVAAAYGRHDPARAYAWAAQVLGKRTDIAPARLIDEVSSSLAARDADAAAEFMKRTDDPAVRQSLMSELAIRKGQDDLGYAWQWLGQHKSDPAYTDAAQNLLYRWSYTKPDEVAQLVPQLGDAVAQAAATAHLVQFWQKKDPAGYRKWVASLPPGQLRENVLAAQ